MSKKQKFHDLCEAQIERLGATFPDIRFMKMGALQELSGWLESRAKGDEQQAIGFITSVTEMAAMPTIAEMNKLWHQMFNAPEEEKRIAAPSCEWCTGTGWEDIEGVVKSGPFAGQPCSGVARCRCGGMPPAAKSDVAYGQNRKEK